MWEFLTSDRMYRILHYCWKFCTDYKKWDIVYLTTYLYNTRNPPQAGNLINT